MATDAALARWKRRGNTTQRGLGHAHQALRQRLLPAAIGTVCPGPWHGKRSPRCTRIMVDPKLMDLDDDPPRVFGPPQRWRMCCTRCNRGAGAKLSNAMQAARRQRARLPQW